MFSVALPIKYTLLFLVNMLSTSTYARLIKRLWSVCSKLNSKRKDSLLILDDAFSYLYIVTVTFKKESYLPDWSRSEGHSCVNFFPGNPPVWRKAVVRILLLSLSLYSLAISTRNNFTLKVSIKLAEFFSKHLACYLAKRPNSFRIPDTRYLLVPGSFLSLFLGHYVNLVF